MVDLVFLLHAHFIFTPLMEDVPPAQLSVRDVTALAALSVQLKILHSCTSTIVSPNARQAPDQMFSMNVSNVSQAAMNAIQTIEEISLTGRSASIAGTNSSSHQKEEASASTLALRVGTPISNSAGASNALVNVRHVNPTDTSALNALETLS